MGEWGSGGVEEWESGRGGIPLFPLSLHSFISSSLHPFINHPFAGHRLRIATITVMITRRTHPMMTAVRGDACGWAGSAGF